MSLFSPAATILYSAMFVLVESRVCSTIDVRNTPSHINDFRDCRVIQGHLQVILMERAEDATDYYNNSFADLYEITDYLTVFRVRGLPSLDLIFPNLTVIGGNNLFFGYALVLYDLPDLEEIGLVNLQTIGNGSVKIHYCPQLCYVDTLNWTAIGASHISLNSSLTCDEEFCQPYCGGFCWNVLQCQNTIYKKCHPLCIGCTQPDSPKHCITCKYFNDNGTCVYSCPTSKLIDDESSSCLTPQECVSETRNWSIFKRGCIEQCPFRFTRDSRGNCVLSNVTLCSGIKITNYIDLKQVMFCTHIIGALEISLKGYVTMEDLEEGMKEIVSISEYLKIARSHSITSLSFFQRLETIKGEKLWSRHYALFVVENQNLQKLFDDNITLSLGKGEALFQKNPNLCDSEIQKLNVTSNYSNSNGLQTSCKSTLLNVTIVERNSTNITLSWVVENNSTVMGYTVYYIEETMNDTASKLKDGFVDNSGQPLDGWSSVFVQNSTILLKGLKPYTHYCYYIKTIFFSKLEQESPISCMRTATGDPSEPVDVETESQSDTTIILHWKHPHHVNGNLSYYKLAVYLSEDYLPIINQRNYCIHPFKENCSCSQIEEETQLFSSDSVCMGTGDHYCNAKTVYHTNESSKDLQVAKRSTEETHENFVEHIINTTNGSESSYKVNNLRHFTLYLLYLQACNAREEEGEREHCGGAELAIQRTKKRIGADDVTNVKVKVNDQNPAVSWMKPSQPNSVIVAYNVEYKRLNSSSSVLICRQSQHFQDDTCEIEISDLEVGSYSVRVWATSLAGPGDPSEWVFFEVYSRIAWIDGFLIFVAVVVGALLVLVIWRKYKLAKSDDARNLLVKMSFERNKLEEDDEWKLDDETVEIIKELSQNSIGILYRKQDEVEG